MKVINPFQMNDWDIKNILIFIFIIQLSLWIIVGLSYIGINIPIISEILTFLSLFFINGILILRILKIHDLGNVENLLYAVGLSLAATMFLGMLIDLDLSIYWNTRSNFKTTINDYIHFIYTIFMLYMLFME